MWMPLWSQEVVRSIFRLPTFPGTSHVKAAVTEKYDEWLAMSVNDLTAAGNPKAPPRKNVVEWFTWVGTVGSRTYKEVF